MRFQEFRRYVEDGSCFERLDRDAHGRRAGSWWPWLRLLRTEAIEDWATAPGSRAVRKAVELKDGHCEPVLELLLARHLLHLGSRRDPGRLAGFWRWALPGGPGPEDLWERADLADTLDPSLTPREQERRFAAILRQAADQLRAGGGPAWAVRTLERLGRTRSGEVADNAAARVVFGWDGDPPEALRPGLVVEFRLLAAAAGAPPIRDDHVFDPTFLDAMAADVRSRIGEPFRHLEHDWGFLGEPVLTGTSGTMAVWLAQYLAVRGRFREGTAWSVPPWIVVTSSLERAGAGAGGSAAPVGLLREKAELLVEEGVRVLAVADDGAGGATTARALGVPGPGSEDLAVVPRRGGVGDAPRSFYERGHLVAADLSALEARYLPPPYREDRDRRRRRIGARLDRRRLGDDFVPRRDWLDDLTAALRR